LGATELFELFTAHWKSALLAAGVEHRIFVHLDEGRRTVATIAEASGIPERSLRALLDGLTGLGVIETADGITYTNVAAASAHLIPGKPGYLGTFAKIVTGDGDGGMKQWSRLGEAVASGAPVLPETILAPDHPFWQELVRALGPISREVAAIAADAIGIRGDTELHALDAGGGAGAYAAIWLARGRSVEVTQIDWPAVNAVARSEIEREGTGARFHTRDGDLHELDWGDGVFDAVILSNIAHHEPPDRNVALFRKAHRCLRPDGRLVLSEFILDDDRRGPSFALRFSAGMLLQTVHGASYREADYREWLADAGFTAATTHREHALSTLIIAEP
jgi:SAM-dependent methyltransferase